MTPQELAKQVNSLLKTDAVRMGSDPAFVVKFLRTGILPIDIILSGGLARNRIAEFYGGFSSLKSYIGLSAIAETQKSGGVCALVDTENTFDSVWASSIGVNVGDLIIPPVNSGEEAVDVSDILIRNGIDLLVWDSVAATLPQDESKKRMAGENVSPARQAALMSTMLRRLNTANFNTAIMFINQTREKVGIVFGSPETTPGGKSLPFYASYRVAMRKGKATTSEIETFDGNEKVKVKRTVSYQVRATLEKSKLSAPGREFVFTWDTQTNSIDEVGFLIGVGMESGVIKQSGPSWKLGTKSVVGKDKFKAWLRTDKSAQEMILTASGYGYLTGNRDQGKSKAGVQKKTLRLKKA